MKFSIIVDNRVINIIEADSKNIAESVIKQGIAVESNSAGIGWVYDIYNGLKEHKKPSFNEYTEKLIESKEVGEAPVWNIVPLVGNELTVAQKKLESEQAAAAKTESINAATTNISNDDLVTYLKYHTLDEIDTYVTDQFSVLATMIPIEIDTYLDTNVTDLSSAVSVLKVLSKDLAATMTLLRITTKMAAFAAKKEL